MFNLFDDDQTGKVSLRNLKRVAKELGETMSGKFLSTVLSFIEMNFIHDIILIIINNHRCGITGDDRKSRY